MNIKNRKSSVFAYASAALLAMGVAGHATGSKYTGNYCTDKLAKTEKEYKDFTVNFSKRVDGGVSRREFVRLQAKRANFVHKINNFSFADCTCDDDDDCDISPT